VSVQTETQSQFISILINGESREIPSGRSVAAMLEWLGVASERVAVELNKAIVRKRDWERTPVTAGSQVEVVEFVGGG
jgi:thiamine biosynthesis protein ThiS